MIKTIFYSQNWVSDTFKPLQIFKFKAHLKLRSVSWHFWKHVDPQCFSCILVPKIKFLGLKHPYIDYFMAKQQFWQFRKNQHLIVHLRDFSCPNSWSGDLKTPSWRIRMIFIKAENFEFLRTRPYSLKEAQKLFFI